MPVMDRSAQGLGLCGGAVRARVSMQAFRLLLMVGGASAALFAGSGPAEAEGRTFVWNGNENQTSFAKSGNWDRIWEEGGQPVLDGNGNPIYEQIPVVDADGNPLFEKVPVTDEEGNPLFDEEGNQIFEHETDEDGNPILGEDGKPVLKVGDQMFEPSAPLLVEPHWVEGPPDGLDTMVVTAGTPNINSQGRRILDLNLSGGEFISRNSKFNVSTFYIDGTLDISGSGAVEIGEGAFGKSILIAAKVNMSSGSVGGWLDPDTGTLGAGLLVVTESMEQSGGKVSDIEIQTPSYALSGGTLSAKVDFETEFTLSGDGTVEAAAVLTGGEGSTMTQSGGSMDGTVSGLASYTHSGGSIGGEVTTASYALTDSAATSAGGVITASERFDLAPTSGTAIVEGRLTGTGNLIKSGDSTVVLANGQNDFTGTVAVNAGTLEVLDDALPDYSTVSVADGATLVMNTSNYTVFMGTIEGAAGELVKEGAATLTLGGDVTLGGLNLNAGRVEVGTGTSTNTVSFDYAVVDEGTTLHVATGATLTIRIPNNLVNNGTFINDGTVHDDLANTGPFVNNGTYNAKVLSNTDSIDNNADGVWTGDILSNANRISNNVGASWSGNVQANSGTLYNHGEWSGDVVKNSGSINNFGGIWTGDIRTNNGQIANNESGSWVGDVLGNNNAIFNMAGSEWNGDVVGNGGSSNTNAQIINRGEWNGTVKGNSGLLFNDGGVWEGNVAANAGSVLNLDGTWKGDVLTNKGVIGNRDGATWTGDVAGNTGSIDNDSGSTWTGSVSNRGWVTNYATATWNGDVVANSGSLSNQGQWTGDVLSSESQVANELGGTWTGDIRGNNNAIFNMAGSVWNGHVVANEGGSNQHTQIVNRGVWTGDVQTNAKAIYNEEGGIWNGDVLANAGIIGTDSIWNGNFTSAGRVYAEGEIHGFFNNSGWLNVVGSLSGITTLTNTGTLSLQGNGASQILTVGAANFGDGSYFDIDVDATGANDKLIAGTASVDGTVRVSAGTMAGPYDPLTVYTIVSATSVTGTFDDVTTDLAFLTPILRYDDTTVQLGLDRNDVRFAEAGRTANQRAAAGGVESLGIGNEVHDAMLWLTQEQAAKAFDSVSGEAYASFESVSIQSAAVLADLLTARLDRTFDALDEDRPILVSAYAEAPSMPSALAPGAARQGGGWIAAYGATANLGDGNAAAVDSTMGGVAGGFDGSVGDWRMGAMLHVGRTSAEVDDRSTSGDSTDYGAGLYGGRQWGATRLSLGAAYTRHDWDASRNVGFPGFSDSLSADYSTGTAQAFGKLSHAFDLGVASLVPYASLAYVNQSADAFRETGGAAALESKADAIDATFTTLGLGGRREFLLGDRLMTAKAAVGWRHAYSDTAGVTQTLAGGDSFFLVGASVPRDMAVLNAGLNLNFTPDTTIGLAYDGQVGSDGAQTHALKGAWATQF